MEITTASASVTRTPAAEDPGTGASGSEAPTADAPPGTGTAPGAPAHCRSPRDHDATAIPSPGERGPRGTVLGRTERLMHVRLLADHGPSGTAARTGQMATGPWVLDLDGRPTGAAASVLVDDTLATSLHAAEPALRWIVTTELVLNVLRPLPADGTVLESWTRTGVTDASGGMASGTVRGPDGTPFVEATGWFQAVGANDPAAVAHFEAMASRPLGPDTEVPLGALLGAEGPTPAAPDDRHEAAGAPRPGLGFAQREELHNPHGAVHGGALTMMASLAAQQAMPDRVDFDLQSLRVMFLRGAEGPVSSRTRVRHAGRALRVVEVELYGAARGPGKPFVHAEAAFRRA